MPNSLISALICWRTYEIQRLCQDTERNKHGDQHGLYKAARAYYPLVMGGAGPRLSVDGQELRIYKADAMAFKALREATKKRRAQ